MISFGIIWTSIALLAVGVSLLIYLMRLTTEYLRESFGEWVDIFLPPIVIVTALAWLVWAAQ